MSGGMGCRMDAQTERYSMQETLFVTWVVGVSIVVKMRCSQLKNAGKLLGPDRGIVGISYDRWLMKEAHFMHC